MYTRLEHTQNTIYIINSKTDKKTEASGDSENSEILKQMKLEIWANAQRDGRPAEYRWRPLFNAAKFG